MKCLNGWHAQAAANMLCRTLCVEYFVGDVCCSCCFSSQLWRFKNELFASFANDNTHVTRACQYVLEHLFDIDGALLITNHAFCHDTSEQRQGINARLGGEEGRVASTNGVVPPLVPGHFIALGTPDQPPIISVGLGSIWSLVPLLLASISLLNGARRLSSGAVCCTRDYRLPSCKKIQAVLVSA
jgi:hypothetical protein|mmetsp:Transcript_93084/g.156360  ORF Transcript_93084/g.156360 Transcript_93084/m.156360 type:complete len:185 (+) Transcript_93084:2526-3080(+)